MMKAKNKENLSWQGTPFSKVFPIVTCQLIR